MATGSGQVEPQQAAARNEPIQLARESDFRIGPLTVRPSLRSIVRNDGREETIEPRVMQVLVALGRRGGGTVGRDELVSRCWDGRIVGDDAINRVISRLRRLAATMGDGLFRVETVTRVGYRLVTSAAAPADTRPLPSTDPAPVVSAVAQATSVAVLPFANLTGDLNKDYLADGMAEELITTLSRSSDLRVAARTSTFSYKGRSVDVRSIARELGVDAILEGSVRVAGDRIRVAAQLIDADSGFHLWSQSYDRDIRDLFAVQDELAGSIAATLRAKLGGGEMRSVDQQAYDLYLQARALSSRAVPESLLRAIELHRQAIARDPGFSRAWGGLAGTLMVAAVFGVVPRDRRAEARASAEQAIRLDPGAAGARAILGALDASGGAWLRATAQFRAAIELDPNEPTAIEAMALQLLAPCGQLRSAADLTLKAARLDPASDNRQLSCALIANLLEDADSSSEHLETALLMGLPSERGNVQVLQSEIARKAGKFDEAAQRMAAALGAVPPLRAAGIEEVIGKVYAALAEREDRGIASRAIDDFMVRAAGGEALWRVAAIPGYLLTWQVALPALNGAFAIAEQLVAEWRRSGHVALSALPLFWRQDMRAFRRDGRFESLVERLDMIPFWERHGPPDGYELSDGRLAEVAPPAEARHS